MTQDEIIEMAKQWASQQKSWKRHSQLFTEKFAELIAADEREACAKVCEHSGGFKDGYSCASAIRARGQA